MGEKIDSNKNSLSNIYNVINNDIKQKYSFISVLCITQNACLPNHLFDNNQTLNVNSFIIFVEIVD